MTVRRGRGALMRRRLLVLLHIANLLAMTCLKPYTLLRTLPELLGVLSSHSSCCAAPKVVMGNGVGATTRTRLRAAQRHACMVAVSVCAGPGRCGPGGKPKTRVCSQTGRATQRGRGGHGCVRDARTQTLQGEVRNPSQQPSCAATASPSVKMFAATCHAVALANAGHEVLFTALRKTVQHANEQGPFSDNTT